MSESETKRVALVTGASRGIGNAILQRLAHDGYYVIGTATTSTGAEKISAQLQEQHLDGHGWSLDVTNSESLELLMSHLDELNSMPAVLVNNAGITSDNLFLRMEDDEWYKVIETNLNAVYRMSKLCVKSMFRSRWGRIITIGSVVGSMGNSGQANYCAAKAGVIGMSKAIAQEVASRGVTVNIVAPGFIETDMTEHLADMVKTEMLKRIPMRRMGQVEDIADAVSFLASDRAKYITGETIHVNGGMFMS
ncbi:MAG: 3-oxoacyl-ACP reductase FabG [Legionellaceae bacterium]|nr:3-oxoacyl-ACP reductase FabG [Legionellaceae bacterium]